ncbi:uncharacterized protein K452DRAFT_310246 [Aplosporella prunicola CBS 121167]|uniref:BZIP domain-containing protein n=1 Tax=Aplosporella prunicola CBS 121167 TaxID=1176127 RepID=A0A6A6B770_9PEZI|nr:uncharacterized protein K452DRAFT_310246 [Aplosporella prunicola CBS 121167]KAF2139870.1 hypothetical protein K452DRAFT_310246 [Aplosporella prunicola CBS 121167]
MTSIRQLGSPIECRSCYSMSNQPNPSIASVKTTTTTTTPTYEGHSSESESKKNAQQQQQPGAKRRPSRAGTRSVTTLTAAQLERKRANDREAQRAIRQRTKDHIENLERRVAELTARENANATGRVSEILQRNEELEQENAVLRQRLNHALATLGSAGYAAAAAESNGLPSESGILATSGAPSPSDRTLIINQPRPATTPGARSMPAVTAAAPSNVPSQADWHHPHAHQHAHSGYSPAPSSSGAESAPPVDVSAPPDAMRWSPHGHPVNTPVAVAESSMHPVDQSVQHSMSYGYVLDPNGRPMQYQSDAQPQSMAYSHMPVSNPPPPPPQYHEQRHLAVQPSYPQYPQPQGYIPSSAHHAGENMPTMMQRSPMEGQHMMYSIPSNVKPEQ